ncbi:hypothetical protein BGZ80_007657, partial [Entomortierella chlamydospora]
PGLYMVCYENSFMMRQLMGKLYSEEIPETSSRHVVRVKTAARLPYPAPKSISPILSSAFLPPSRRPKGPTPPLPFAQLDDGSCATIALINFLINQPTVTHGQTIKNLLQRVQTLKQTNASQR